MLLSFARRLRKDIDAALAVVFGFGEREAGVAAAEEGLEVAGEIGVHGVEGLAKALAHHAAQLLERLLYVLLGDAQVGHLRAEEAMTLTRFVVVGLRLRVYRPDLANLGA